MKAVLCSSFIMLVVVSFLCPVVAAFGVRTNMATVGATSRNTRTRTLAAGAPPQPEPTTANGGRAASLHYNTASVRRPLMMMILDTTASTPAVLLSSPLPSSTSTLNFANQNSHDFARQYYHQSGLFQSSSPTSSSSWGTTTTTAVVVAEQSSLLSAPSIIVNEESAVDTRFTIKSKEVSSEEVASKRQTFNTIFWGGGIAAPFIATVFYFGFKFWEK